MRYSIYVSDVGAIRKISRLSLSSLKRTGRSDGKKKWKENATSTSWRGSIRRIRLSSFAHASANRVRMVSENVVVRERTNRIKVVYIIS
jgi:hypothetical protein